MNYRVSSFLFTITIFLSAYLLFLIQPMVGKVLLPILGGTPSVWNTAMVFFQILLLGGYLYAHFLTKLSSIRLQIIVHGALLTGAFLLLPMGISFAPPSDGPSPLLWQIQTMAQMIGLPFFMLSTSAPLLQRWFSHSNHPDADNPYFLYAASNIGSVLALILYPTITERFLPLFDQTKLFQYGFFALMLGLIGSGLFITHKSKSLTEVSVTENTGNTDSPSLKMIAVWTLLAFVPSSLMLGFTSFVVTDIGSVPMFWVIPLTLYILSFVVAFSQRNPLSLSRTKTVFMLLFLGCYFIGGIYLQTNRWEVAIAHAVLLFVTALMCHKDLYDLRPSPRHLTLFFLVLSVGGALGGIFNALIAPITFVRPYEYMIAAALSVLCWGYQSKDKFLIPVALIILVALPVVPWDTSSIKMTYQSRNYFGTLNVVEQDGFRVVSHGTTVHGAQSMNKKDSLIPLTYYHSDGALSKALKVAHSQKKQLSVGALGLGVGSIKCQLDKTDRIDFYEIDPDMIALAENRDFFTYISDCPAHHSIILGDARLKLKEAPDASYDVILADAFSSDNIPLHLITKEAAALYMQKIKKDGMVIFHISNRFLSLAPELGLIGKSLNISALEGYTQPEETTKESIVRTSPVRAVVFTTNQIYIKKLKEKGWKDIAKDETQSPWTDDFANPLRSMIRKTLTTSSQ